MPSGGVNSLSRWERESNWVADALHFDFNREVLSSSNLAVAAAFLPFCSDLF